MLPLPSSFSSAHEAEYAGCNPSAEISALDENKNVSFPLLISEGNDCFAAFGSSWLWSLVTRIIKGKKRQGEGLGSRAVCKPCVPIISWTWENRNPLCAVETHVLSWPHQSWLPPVWSTNKATPWAFWFSQDRKVIKRRVSRQTASVKYGACFWAIPECFSKKH